MKIWPLFDILIIVSKNRKVYLKSEEKEEYDKRFFFRELGVGET